VSAGPLLLAIPVAAAAGAVTFLSPCVLPLVPGYLSYITGMSGAAVASPDIAEAAGAGGPGDGQDAVPRPTAPRAAGRGVAAPARPSRSRVLAGATLFIIGFSALFAVEGVAFGGIGATLRDHQVGLSRVLGVLLIALGLLFAGAFDRFGFSGRMFKPAVRP